MSQIADFDKLIHTFKDHGLVNNVVSRESKTFFQTLDKTRHSFRFDVHNPEDGITIEENIKLNPMKASQSYGTFHKNQTTSNLRDLIEYYNVFEEK